MRTCVRISIRGSSYQWFKSAIEKGDLPLIRQTASELPRVNLEDALAVLTVIAVKEPNLYERAACRWLARLALERDVTLDRLRVALAELDELGNGSDTAPSRLAQLANRS